MNIPCPLYPDPLEQRYRDQSATVITKAEAEYARRTSRRTKNTPRLSTYPGATASAERKGPDYGVATGSLIGRVSLHLDTVAVTEFLSSYVPKSPYDYLSVIYQDQRLETSLLAPIQAVSLAMTACKLKSLQVLAHSRRMYAIALADTNIALSNPELAIQDRTLVSVILLGLFEALAGQLSGMSSNWAAHTQGAVALLSMRGEIQFTNNLGRRLFDQICSILTFDTMVRKVPMSPTLLGLVYKANQLHHETAKTAFVKLIGEISATPCVLWEENMDPKTKLAKATSLDAKVVQFTRDLPSDYQYEEWAQALQNRTNSGWSAYGYKIHQYQHHHAARMWNACRVLRIKLNSVAHKILSQLPSTVLSTPEEWKTALQVAAKKIEGSASEVCASVPQILTPTEFDKIGIEMSQEARVATLLPALSVVKAESLVPPAIKSYATDRLKYLEKESKRFQAENAATSELGLEGIRGGFHMLYVY